MTTPRWQRLEQLFAAAADLDEPARKALLDERCGDDLELRREVESLLAADSRPGDLVAAVLEGEAAGLLEAPGPGRGLHPGPLRAGQRLGAWRLEEEIGAGGMSTVYRAHRADRQFDKQVALKVVKRGMDTEELLRRFAVERHILARLEHPGIARLLDAGSTEAGRPYFVMELVEGVPIDRYCDLQHLSLDRRLDLFLAVCRAVAYAHRNLVVHRDLKPGNILVTAAGQPKLLDFGIAKLLDPEQVGAAVTTASFRLLTPGYASPEQIEGAAITTASDVYSLGVLLYELLSGRRPYRPDEASAAALEHCVLRQEPQRPSTAVLRPQEEAAETLAERRGDDVRGLVRQLRGDLDAIVLKALRKEPGERYASVEHLAEDLERHRRRLPVSARRGTFRYRAGRFLRRHRLGVGVAAAAALTVLAFTAALAVQTWRLTREREVSQQRWRRAEAVKDFMIQLFPVAQSQDEDARLTVRELLNRGAGRLAAEPAAEPATQAALLDTVARIYQRLGRYADATPFLEQALDLYRQSMGPVSTEVANALNSLAIVRVQQGDYAAAEPLFRETLALRRKLFAPPHELISSSLNNLALLLHDRGDYAQAEGLYREALAMDEVLYGRQDPWTATVVANLGLLLHDRGDYGEAEALLREALAVWEKRHGPEAEDLAGPLTHLGSTLAASTAPERLAEAEASLRRALAILEAQLGPEHPEVARVLEPLAEFLRRQGKASAATELNRRALELRRRSLGPEHPEVATSLAGLGQALADLGELPAAEDHLRQAVELQRRKLGPGHPTLAASLAGLGRVLVERGACAEAEPLLDEALAIERRQLLPGHPRIAAAEAWLTRCR